MGVEHTGDGERLDDADRSPPPDRPGREPSGPSRRDSYAGADGAVERSDDPSSDESDDGPTTSETPQGFDDRRSSETENTSESATSSEPREPSTKADPSGTSAEAERDATDRQGEQRPHHDGGQERLGADHGTGQPSRGPVEQAVTTRTVPESKDADREHSPHRSASSREEQTSADADAATDEVDGGISEQPYGQPDASNESSDRYSADADTESTESIAGNATVGERDQSQLDRSASPLEHRPSYHSFDSLADEVDARARSRESIPVAGRDVQEARPDKKPNDRPPTLDFRVQGQNLRHHIDPNAGSAKSAGSIDVETESAGDRTIAALEEGESDRKSRLERFRSKAHKSLETALDGAKSKVDDFEKILDSNPRPTGSHTVANPDRPTTQAPHQASVGDAATALLAGGIVVSELIRKVHTRLEQRKQR